MGNLRMRLDTIGEYQKKVPKKTGHTIGKSKPVNAGFLNLPKIGKFPIYLDS